MARTWLSITVELLGGRGEDLWPPPGRTFAVGPSHTFMDLADAINTAFARWDRAHLSEFTLPDGTLIADLESSLDLVSSGFGPVQLVKEIERTKVAKTVELGDEFRFVFDLGDNWVHRCEVHPVKVDPVETLGIRPKTPLPYWGGETYPTNMVAVGRVTTARPSQTPNRISRIRCRTFGGRHRHHSRGPICVRCAKPLQPGMMVSS